LVNVSVPARVDKVPVVGSVTLVVPVAVNVVANAPEVIKLPPSVIVLAALLTPVPPYVGEIIVAAHVPDVTLFVMIMLLLVRFDETDASPVIVVLPAVRTPPALSPFFTTKFLSFAMVHFPL
jgi:hypothetical protein